MVLADWLDEPLDLPCDDWKQLSMRVNAVVSSIVAAVDHIAKHDLRSPLSGCPGDGRDTKSRQLQPLGLALQVIGHLYATRRLLGLSQSEMAAALSMYLPKAMSAKTISAYERWERYYRRYGTPELERQFRPGRRTMSAYRSIVIDWVIDKSHNRLWLVYDKKSRRWEFRAECDQCGRVFAPRNSVQRKCGRHQ